ncbi:MAG: aromatic-ring-hydroxylating dioxygenase subunit beta, partial [Acetobacteraceae bacterium]
MTTSDIIRFLYREARLLDEKRWEEWYALFTEDAFYWAPLTRDQPDGVNHTSLAYEDKLLLRLRIERLRRHPPSQRPASWSQHVLQVPEIDEADDAAG